MQQWVSVNEAANIKKVSRQAIYLAIKSKKLKSYMKNEKLKVRINDLDDYYSKKYSRFYHSLKDGEPIFTKGTFTAEQVAEKLGIDIQKIYYALRTKKLNHKRVDSRYLITSKDIHEFKNNFYT